MSPNKRIMHICSNISRTDMLYDIGTDHAYLPIYCIEAGIVQKAVVTDINRGPLERAAANIASYGLHDRIETCLCDGLGQLELVPGSTVVIAGVGGDMTISILDEARLRFKKDITFILQPASSSERVKKYLIDKDFRIIKESFFLYRKNPYIIIKCVFDGRNEKQTDKYDKVLFIPENYDMTEKDALRAFIWKALCRQKKILGGQILEKDPGTRKQIDLVKELERYHESI